MYSYVIRTYRLPEKLIFLLVAYYVLTFVFLIANIDRRAWKTDNSRCEYRKMQDMVNAFTSFVNDN